MRLTGKNILIVDDDASLRLLLRKILETAGLLVDDAESVRIAIGKIQSKLPDLIILDLNMPDHDGFIFLKFRAQNRLIHSIPVLVLSADAKAPIVEKALAMGANQFLEKPLKANLVLQKVRSLSYSQEHFSYRFPPGHSPVVTVEINCLITGYSESQLKITGVSKFDRGKTLQIKSESYEKAGGSALVGKIDNRLAKVEKGLYSQSVTLAGISQEDKERFYEWAQSL